MKASSVESSSAPATNPEDGSLDEADGSVPHRLPLQEEQPCPQEILPSGRSDESTAALEARVALHEARSRARLDGRAPDWYRARPDSQRWIGLVSDGTASCLNPVLQALFLLPEVRALVFRFAHEERAEGKEAAADCSPLQLARLFAHMLRSRLSAVSPRALVASLGSPPPEHRADEVWHTLFRSLHAHGLPLRADLFEGQYHSLVQCAECGHATVTHPSFWHVPLNVTGRGSVVEALQHRVKWERMDGEQRWHCSRCARRVAAHQRSTFHSLPRLLLLLLQRGPHAAAARRRRARSRVLVPPTLLMDDFRTPDDLAGSGGRGGVGEGEERYDCMAMLMQRVGRHTAVARPGVKEQWYEFDDAHVRALGMAPSEGAAAHGGAADGGAVERAAGKGSRGAVAHEEHCYMAIYRRRDAEASEAALHAAAPAAPPASLLSDVEEEGVEAAALRRLQVLSEALLDVRLIPAYDVSSEVSLTLHADAPLAALHRAARRALPPPAEHGMDDGLEAALASLDSATPAPSALPAEEADLAAPRMNFRRWDSTRWLPGEPVEALYGTQQTLRSAGLTSSCTLLVEPEVHPDAKGFCSPMPPPHADDMYVRMRVWTSSESAVPADEMDEASTRTAEWVEDDGGKSAQSAAPDNKRVRFALLAELKAELPDGGTVPSSYNSRGRRLTWSNFNFESVLLRRSSEETSPRHPPPPSSASSVSSRRSSCGAASTTSATEDEDEIGSEIAEMDEFGVEQLLRVPPAGGASGGGSSAEGGGRTLSDLRHAVHLRLGIPPELQRLVLMCGGAAELLGEGSAAISELRLRADERQAELIVEEARSADAPCLLHQRLESRRHRLTLCFNSIGSGEYRHRIRADARETADSLKQRIAAALGVSGGSIRLRRGPRGAHLRAEDESVLQELGLTDGAAVYVEEGPSLRRDEFLVHAYWCEPPAAAVDEAEDEGAADRGERERETSPPKATGYDPDAADARRSRRSVSWATAAEVAEFIESSGTISSPSSSRSSSRSRSSASSRAGSRSRSVSPTLSTGSDSAGSGANTDADDDDERTPVSIDPVATISQQERACSVSVASSATVSTLRRKLRVALASIGSYPPGQPNDRLSVSLSSHRLRVYVRESGWPGEVLRGTELAQQRLVSDVYGSAQDGEVVLQLLRSDERLNHDQLLVGYLLLNAVGSPDSSGALHARANWTMAALLDSLSDLTAIPIPRLAVAKAPGGRRLLTSHQLRSLDWDSPSVLEAASLSSIPLQLKSGDVLVVRDRMHPPPRPPLVVPTPTRAPIARTTPLLPLTQPALMTPFRR
ncbi:hypothetical protein AB1Y20_004549 [Prymnesium parvum]|uniref:Ubiquitinyl hydrolase 1 n=1 Tax=Prymnesium parvum TaxID=97485 RepID=A0AB34IZ23_PRYPA